PGPAAVSSLPAPPAPDAEVAGALRARLEEIEYSDARVVDLMDGTGWLTRPSDLAIVGRRVTGNGPFATAFRLFYLGLEVDGATAERALAPVSLGALAGLGGPPRATRSQWSRPTSTRAPWGSRASTRPSTASGASNAARGHGSSRSRASAST